MSCCVSFARSCNAKVFGLDASLLESPASFVELLPTSGDVFILVSLPEHPSSRISLSRKLKSSIEDSRLSTALLALPSSLSSKFSEASSSPALACTCSISVSFRALFKVSSSIASTHFRILLVHAAFKA